MESSERRTLNGLQHESLDARFYPDNPESPTYGHLQALVAVANGQAIEADIKEAILQTATRHKENLERVVDTWNKVSIFPKLATDHSQRMLTVKMIADAMIHSYGSIYAGMEDRRKLFTGAMGLLSTGSSFN